MTIADTVDEKLKAAPPEIAQKVSDVLDLLERFPRSLGREQRPSDLRHVVEAGSRLRDPEPAADTSTCAVHIGRKLL